MRTLASTLEEVAATDPLSTRRRAVPGSRPAGRLSVTIIYEDAGLRQWARGICDRVAQLVGEEAVRCTWWKLADLGEPAVLAGAVSTTLRADIIVVAVHAAEGFPLPFYVWVDSWLPHRPQGSGVLVGLVAFPEWLNPPMDRAREYLQAVAREGRLDFLFEERRSDLPMPGSNRQSSPVGTSCDDRAPALRGGMPAGDVGSIEFED